MRIASSRDGVVGLFLYSIVTSVEQTRITRHAIRPFKFYGPRLLKHSTLSLPLLLIKVAWPERPHIFFVLRMGVIKPERAIVFTELQIHSRILLTSSDLISDSLQLFLWGYLDRFAHWGPVLPFLEHGVEGKVFGDEHVVFPLLGLFGRGYSEVDWASLELHFSVCCAHLAEVIVVFLQEASIKSHICLWKLFWGFYSRMAENSRICTHLFLGQFTLSHRQILEGAVWFQETASMIDQGSFLRVLSHKRLLRLVVLIPISLFMMVLCSHFLPLLAVRVGLPDHMMLLEEVWAACFPHHCFNTLSPLLIFL